MGSEIDENALIKMAVNFAQERTRSRALALADGKRRLPLITVGTGTTTYTRRMRPEEVPERCPRLRGLAERYWRAKWPSDPDADRYKLDDAIDWARNNSGPQRNEPQHEHWYAQKIRDLAVFLSPDIGPDEIDDFDIIIEGAVESACQIGALYREVRWKLEHEKAALDAYELLKKKLEGAVRGGDTTRRVAEERKIIFTKIALQSVLHWVSLSPRRQVAFLKNLARQHDKTEDLQIFHPRGDLLADRWFAEQLSDLSTRGAIQKALQRP